MGQFEERIANAGIVGLDTSLFIYFLERNPRYVGLARIALKGMEDGKWQGVTSTITLMELTVRPWRLGQERIAHEYESLLVNFPNLTIVDIDRHVARRAAQLRARFNISPADALQMAASLSRGAKMFLTNDRRLASVLSVDVAMLDDFVVEE